MNLFHISIAMLLLVGPFLQLQCDAKTSKKKKTTTKKKSAATKTAEKYKTVLVTRTAEVEMTRVHSVTVQQAMEIPTGLYSKKGNCYCPLDD